MANKIDWVLADNLNAIQRDEAEIIKIATAKIPNNEKERLLRSKVHQLLLHADNFAHRLPRIHRLADMVEEEWERE